jgi:hypothetical protein
MSVISIHCCEYPETIGCLLLWGYTSSSYRWRLIVIIPCQSGDTSFDLRVMLSTSALSSDGGWLSRNILIVLIQSYAGSCSGSLITIRSGLVASMSSSASLTEGLDNFSMMTSDEVGALKEAIHAR